jgi:hypothetical protein
MAKGSEPLLRGRRDDGGTKYRMGEKLLSIGDDYWIENERISERSRSTERHCASGTRSCSMTTPAPGAEVSKRWFRIRETYGIEIARARTTRSSLR